MANKGDVVIFSYLLVHGSYVNHSDQMRRMFLIQLAGADDEPYEPNKHRSPCGGMVLRGTNISKSANLNERHEILSENDPKFH